MATDTEGFPKNTYYCELLGQIQLFLKLKAFLLKLIVYYLNLVSRLYYGYTDILVEVRGYNIN